MPARNALAVVADCAAITAVGQISPNMVVIARRQTERARKKNIVQKLRAFLLVPRMQICMMRHIGQHY
jgi:hypothetical protein